MGTFLPQDQSGSGWPSQVHRSVASATQAPSRMPPSASHRRVPPIGGVEGVDRVADGRSTGAAEREPHPGVAARAGETVVAPAESRADQDLGARGLSGPGRYCGGSASTPRPAPRCDRRWCCCPRCPGAACRPAPPRRRCPGDPKTSATDESRRSASTSPPSSPYFGMINGDRRIDIDVQPAIVGRGRSCGQARSRASLAPPGRGSGRRRCAHRPAATVVVVEATGPNACSRSPRD